MKYLVRFRVMRAVLATLSSKSAWLSPGLRKGGSNSTSPSNPLPLLSNDLTTSCEDDSKEVKAERKWYIPTVGLGP
ncbi:MAG: hypothetical protein F4X44_01610 [Gammaproteobacteria bacterium]|nr:hypothetical protein [Gammaproteobacteria bacterium]